jgi:hypothetical protein
MDYRDLLDRILGGIKPTVTKVKIHKHEWYTIRISDYIKYTDSHGDSRIMSNNARYDSYYERISMGTNRVCTECGACDDGADRMDQAMTDQIKRLKDVDKIARRKRLWAEQLWNDGCKTK